VLFVGKAQEKAPVFRTQRRKNPNSGASHVWSHRSTAMMNQLHSMVLYRDVGPFFVKFCSCPPYKAKLCMNGPEYAKLRLDW